MPIPQAGAQWWSYRRAPILGKYTLEHSGVMEQLICSLFLNTGAKKAKERTEMWARPGGR